MILSIAVILIGIVSLVNLGLWFYVLKNFSEKLGLLSHVAVQYLNEKEQAISDKLSATSTTTKSPATSTTTVKVANDKFVARRRR